MGKVRDILRVKGNNVYSVEPTIMVYQAIHLMCEKNIERTGRTIYECHSH